MRPDANMRGSLAPQVRRLTSCPSHASTVSATSKSAPLIASTMSLKSPLARPRIPLCLQWCEPEHLAAACISAQLPCSGHSSRLRQRPRHVVSHPRHPTPCSAMQHQQSVSDDLRCRFRNLHGLRHALVLILLLHAHAMRSRVCCYLQRCL